MKQITKMQVKDQFRVDGQYVVFSLGNEKYGIGISSVKEIIKWEKITRLPQIGDEIKGVIKLRDEIVPVISLRNHFGLPEVDNMECTRIIILEEDAILLGIIVDRVDEVVTVPEQTIELPSGIPGIRSDVIQGIAKFDDWLLILIDIKCLFVLGVIEPLHSSHIDETITAIDGEVK